MDIFSVLRIAFLVSLVLTIFFMNITLPPTITLGWLLETFRRILVLVGLLATGALFIILLFRIDPLPLVRLNAYYSGLEQLVNFDNAIPNRLGENMAVAKVERLDTDCDDFKEWVVFYKFDKRAKSSPMHGVVYDNDRGNPPVIFPYSLSAPDRNYLSEDDVTLAVDVEEVAQNRPSPQGNNCPEIVVSGKNELTIFRFEQNSEVWDFPRDVPARYEPIGFFRGSGDVKFNRATKQVIVHERNGFERSQLATRSVYALRPDPQTGFETYLDPVQPLGETGSPSLAAPIISTIDFFPTPPDDIFNTPFPEKIVLAFYASTCAGLNNSLCNSYNTAWQPQEFLTGDALGAAQAGNVTYFGLPSLSGNENISVSQLRYYPQSETDPDRLESGAGRDVVTGEQAQEGLVEIAFTVSGSALQTRRYQMRLVGTSQGAQWKILGIAPLNTLASPTLPQLQSGGNSETFTPPTPPPPLTNQAPVAMANGPYTGLVCQPLTFSATGSTDPAGGPLNYVWSFGDDTPPEQSASPTHLYTTPGSYTATLTVTNHASLSAQSTAQVTVSAASPPPAVCDPAPCCQ
ncbi:MAG: PKD domain-containing protein [Anaerolineae bacterium]